jgi:hypothetical protein
LSFKPKNKKINTIKTGLVLKSIALKAALEPSTARLNWCKFIEIPILNIHNRIESKRSLLLIKRVLRIIKISNNNTPPMKKLKRTIVIVIRK